MIRRPRQVALVRCTGGCVSRATDISGRSQELTAQATRRLRLSDPLPSGRRVAPWRPGGRGSADAHRSLAWDSPFVPRDVAVELA